MDTISQRVLDIFRTITTIPRESGHEGPMTDFLVNWASEHGLEYKRDTTGNVNIIKPASAGKENVPTLVLQAHQDMVCEKNSGFEHDFSRDPIPYEIEDGWMIARNTTLGADDGIGIAACLAILESDLDTGRLECVFTISEETGMDGAEAMEAGFFDGKTLINLDSEDEGQLFIGCSGGLNTRIVLPYGRVATGKSEALELRIHSAVGGHSGDDINKERMNAVQQMARFLYSELGEGFALLSFNGGGKPNAIARECSAVVMAEDLPALAGRFAAFGKTISSEEFAITEPEVRFESATVSSDGMAVRESDATDLICALFSMPHGVQSMSQTVPGLVETSSNLASVKTGDNDFLIVTSQRSAIPSARRMMSDRIAATFRHTGAEVTRMFEYPGWVPDINSPILRQCVSSYRILFGEEPQVKAIHAGLECGLFLEKFPGLDMISFGPTLRGVHAPGEKLELSSLDRFVELLVNVTENFK